ELNAPLRSVRRRAEVPAEDADAANQDAWSERVHGVDIVGVADVLEAEFIRRSAAENVRLAENKGVIPTPYIEASRGRFEAADEDVVLTVVGQTGSEEKKVLFVSTVVSPVAARARLFNQPHTPPLT